MSKILSIIYLFGVLLILFSINLIFGNPIRETFNVNAIEENPIHQQNNADIVNEISDDEPLNFGFR
jgi:hypothetical protein